MRLTTISLVGIFFVIAVSNAAYSQTTIPWIHNMEQARQVAQRDHRLLLIHFYADWCGPCRTLDRTVFPHPDVGRSISANYVPVKIDVDRNKALAEQYGVTQIPTDVIADANGRVLFHTKSPSDPSQYTQLLNRLASSQSLTTPVHTVATRMPQQGEPMSDAPQNRWETSTWGQTANREQTAASQAYQPIDSGYDARSAWQGSNYGSETSGFYNSSAPPSSGSQNGSRDAGQFATGDPAARPSDAAVPSWNLPSTGPQNQPVPGAESPVVTPPLEQRPAYGAGSPQAGWGQTNPYVSNEPATSNAPFASGWVPPSSNPSPPPGGPVPLTVPADRRGGGFSNPYATDFANAPSSPPPGETRAQTSTTNPPLALDGHCAVTLAEGEKWEKGNPLWGVRHRGRTYLFVSQQQKQKFLADPDRYSPVLSGYDPTRFVDYGEPVPGQRRHGMWFRGKTYLFADEDSLKRFSLNPEYYERKADEIMMAGGR
jgi:YHS domain-containing protein/thiol-disulfide isomerase/thioredoxin